LSGGYRRTQNDDRHQRLKSALFHRGHIEGSIADEKSGYRHLLTPEGPSSGKVVMSLELQVDIPFSARQ
jgi:hypothetical protein